MKILSLRRAKKIECYKALNRRRGIWQNDPVIGTRFIYASQRAGGAPPKAGQGEVVALERAALTPEWQVTTDGLRANSELDESTLCVADTRRVGALDVPSNRLLWTMTRPIGGHRWLDGLLVFEHDRQTLVIVDIHTGAKQEVFSSPEEISFSSLCENWLVYNFWKNGGHHRALDLRTMTITWERDLLSEVHLAHGVETTTVVVRPGSLTGSLVMTAGVSTLGCSLATGEILWKADVFCPYYWPLVANGRIPILTFEEFVVLDEATGAVLCRRQHGLAHVWHARPGSLVSDDVFGTVTEEGHVMLFDMNTAELLSWAQHSVSFHGTAAADGRFFIVGSDGKLWVYEPFS